MSFRAEPGTVTALVGSSGSGKSTIISLVAAFHTPTCSGWPSGPVRSCARRATWPETGPDHPGAGAAGGVMTPGAVSQVITSNVYSPCRTPGSLARIWRASSRESFWYTPSPQSPAPGPGCRAPARRPVAHRSRPC